MESQMDTAGKEVHAQGGEEHVGFNSICMAASEINGDVGIKKQGEQSEEHLNHISMTMPKELPEMDTGKEVHAQDGEEHVSFNSMAASEINRDVGIKIQGEQSEEGTRPAAKTHCQIRPHHISMTMPKEMPEMDTTGNEVHAQDGQDGEEHVAFNSMAASEVDENVGIQNQDEESEEGTHPAAIGAAAGSSYLHPLVLEDSESDSEDVAWIHHPSLPQEGSLLHAVYLQLSGGGFDDGMAVRDLFGSRAVHTLRNDTFTFEKPVAALTESEMEFEETHETCKCLLGNQAT